MLSCFRAIVLLVLVAEVVHCDLNTMMLSNVEACGCVDAAAVRRWHEPCSLLSVHCLVDIMRWRGVEDVSGRPAHVGGWLCLHCFPLASSDSPMPGVLSPGFRFARLPIATD